MKTFPRNTTLVTLSTDVVYVNSACLHRVILFTKPISMLYNYCF